MKCSICNKIKEKSCFYFTQYRGRYYKSSYCKICHRDHAKKHRLKNVSKLKKQHQIWYFINREHALQMRARYYQNNREEILRKNRILQTSEAFKKIKRKRENENVRRLGDSYIKNRLKKNFKLNIQDIPSILIEAKRQQIKLRRSCYEN